MPSKFRQFFEANLRDVVVSSLLFGVSLIILAVLYGRTGWLPELFSKLAFGLLISVLVRLTTVFLYDTKVDESFQRFGMKSVEYLPTVEVGERLKGAERIDVMKTWFPDHPDIRDGLRAALTNQKTKVRLLLSHPDSDLLRARSDGAGQDLAHGAREVIHTLQDLYNYTQDETAKFEIALYNGWPGCPIIWYDKKVLLGFYLRGRSSPFWPWIEIKRGSDFEKKVLRKQFDDLWNVTPKIKDRKELFNWLKDRGELKDLVKKG